jgi:hypothetical protein
MKRSLLWIFVIPLALALLSCGQRKRDAVFYEQMVDSIRKAEQLTEMKRQAGVYDDPVQNFFDTLQLRPLPIQSERRNFAKIGHFGKVPLSLVSMLGYPVDTRLKALLLPRRHGLHALLLEEQLDSINSNLYLYSLDRDYKPIDHLCLYEERDEDRAEDFGRQFMDYYVTSEYEVTILYIFESMRTHKMETEQTRRFQLTEDGNFEEVVVELE